MQLEKRLLDEINKIRIIDPHSHIDPHSPSAKSFDEILGYHYYTELAHSAGMNQASLAPDVPASQRAMAIAEFLPALANTVQYSWLLEIAQTFFGFEDDAIDQSNIARLDAAAAAHVSAADWPEQVLARSAVDKIFLTNDFADSLSGFDTARYVPCLRCDDLVFRLGDRATRERLCRAADCDVTDI